MRVIELADADLAMGNIIVGSPLAVSLTMRGIVGSALGRPGWRDDFDRAIEMARRFDPFSRVLTIMLRGIAIGCGAQLPNSKALDAPSHTCTSTPSFSDGSDGFDVVEWRG